MIQLWNEVNGAELAVLDERTTYTVPLPLIIPNTTTSLISGILPPGMRLVNNSITGTPYEVLRSTRFEFVIRAEHLGQISDRTFSMVVSGADSPVWVTPEGLLPVNSNNLYFILDNTPIDFQLRAMDPDIPAGDTIEYFISEGDGELPPGISLTSDGRLVGIVDPILALDLEAGDGGYDSSPYSKFPLDFGVNTSALGLDSFFYDFTVYDYGVKSRIPRKLNRNYEFIVTATDSVSFTKRKFRIYVVGDDFLRADNNIMKSDTGLYTADNTFIRKPIWLTPANLGVRRANNFITLYLDVLDPNTLAGKVIYKLEQTNDDNTASALPPGISLDTDTGELAGYVPYQPAITKDYKFTITAQRFNTEFGTVAVTGTAYEDTFAGTNKLKLFKLPETLNDGIADIFSLVGRSVNISGNEYTVTSVDNTNLEYDIIILDRNLVQLPYSPLVVNRTAISTNYFFANTLDYNTREFYKKKDLVISNTAKYKIEDIYPYIEIKVLPAVGSAYLEFTSSGDLVDGLTDALSTPVFPAYVTPTIVGGDVTELLMMIPATAQNRNTFFIKSLLKSNTSTDVRLIELSTVERVKLDLSLASNFLQGREFKYSVVRGYSFEEIFNIAETETYKTSKTFTISILGEVESTITWITDSNLPSIVAGRTSTLSVKAETTLVDSVLKYNIISGNLPPGLVLRQNGELSGTVRQYQNEYGLGLTYFDSGNTTFDDITTSFDREFTFTVIARDRFGFSASIKTFTVVVTDSDKRIYSNIFMKPMLKDAQRTYYERFVNNSRIFNPEYIYRPGDPEFGVQTDLKSLVYAGIETKNIENYVTAVAKNHKKKSFYFGDIKTAFAKNPGSPDVVYEVVYIELVDPAQPVVGKTRTSFRAKTQNKITVDSLRYSVDTPGQPYKYRPTPINTITIDSTAVKIDQTTNSLLYVSNLQNMRDRIKAIGSNSADFLPLWMRTQQNIKEQLTRFVPAVPICYTLPGKSTTIVENILNSGFDFKKIHYEIDRYIVSDTLDTSGEQYVLFANYKFNV